MSLLVTVDVEGNQHSRDYSSVDLLNSLVAELEIKMTMFVTPRVAEEKTEVVKAWLRDGHAVGLHIHPERFNRFDSPWLTEYSQDSIEWMLQQGKSVFERELGYDPTLFRAGRWEFSDTMLRALNREGFERDASLSPVQRDMTRSADRYDGLFVRHGIEEFPVSVYDNPLLRSMLTPFPINCIPLDLSTFLKRSAFVPVTYIITARQLQRKAPYTMVVFHDFDLAMETMRDRIRTYLKFISKQEDASTLKQIS